MIVHQQPKENPSQKLFFINQVQNTAKYNIHFFLNQDYNSGAVAFSPVKTRTVNKEKATH